MKKLSFVCVIIMLFFTAPFTRAGIFDLSFGLDVFGTYDDNLLLQSDDEIDASSIDPEDEILQVHPYGVLVYESTRSSIRLQYNFFKEWYNKDHPLDRTDNSYQDSHLDAVWEATDMITLGLSETYTDSLYGLKRTEVPEVRGDYIKNNLSPSVKYHLDDRFSLSLQGNWVKQDYDDNPIITEDGYIGFADWEELGFKIASKIQLLTDTGILFQADMWDRSYDNDVVAVESDCNGYTINTGIEQKLNEKMSFTILADFSHREYDNTASGVSDSSYDRFGGSFVFTDQFSGITRLRIEGFSRMNGSERVSNSFYRDTGVSTTFYTVVSQKVEASFDAQYSKFKYENVSDEWSDNYFKGGVSLGYKMADWLSIRAQYQYAKRTSDHPSDEFEDNLVSIYLHFFYELFR